MSFGAISKPAVLAFSNGAAIAGCWYNTGEGGLSPYHLEGGADIGPSQRSIGEKIHPS
jgi:glutamate synthase domain-containing protein 2